MDHSEILSTQPATLVELLRGRATTQPDRLAYTFIKDDQEEVHLNYAELDVRVRCIAGKLQSLVGFGERAILFYQPGLNFVSAFWACLYSGVIPIPVPPKPNLIFGKAQSIIKDAQPALFLTESSLLPALEKAVTQFPNFASITRVPTDAIGAEFQTEYCAPQIPGSHLALLQYTSGSTSEPKGVMVSHENILRNSLALDLGLNHTAESAIVSWLPHFHDMGFIYGLIQPVYAGIPCYFMSPFSFIQQPFRWLQAITRYRGTHSAAPNFAYDLCTHQITDAQKATLDLSSWSVAVNGAEPIRKATLEAFSKAFASCGFRSTAFCAGYGLAESTLKVTSGEPHETPSFVDVEASALEQHRVIVATAESQNVRSLTSVGNATLDTRVAIVDPATATELPDNSVGEVWVSGSSVAQGYWNRPDETEKVFRSFLVNSGEGPFLRTGDLGFMKAGELFVTGRLKDLIIIRGYNYYPQDIEETVQHSHAAFKSAGAAAFGIEINGEEKLVVVQEVERRALRELDADAVLRSVRSAVAQQHELEVYTVALLKPGALPKTTSGKVQRHLCREKFLNGTLKVVATWTQEQVSDEPVSQVHSKVQANGYSYEALTDWLIRTLAQRLRIKPEEIDVSLPFQQFGINSATAVSIAKEFEEHIGTRLSPTLLYDYPTIQAVALHYAADSKKTNSNGRVKENGRAENEPIAIIGMGCRFPGDVSNPEAFWKLLSGGIDAIRRVPADRWDLDSYYDPDPDAIGKIYTPWGGFIDQVDLFDANFFGIAPRETESLDPQQRLLLEVSWEALEHAGLAPLKLSGSDAGVFFGLSTHDYVCFELYSGNPEVINSYCATGNSTSTASGRVSYLLNLCGPSITVDTACSSSLVAIDLACKSLQMKETHLALAGGVNLMLKPEISINFSRARMLAADGRCKTFDAAADGFVRGEGCGVVVLKRLSDAIADGDNVLALIRSSAVNHDGRSSGLTVPSGPAQEKLIKKALRQASLEANQLSYIEAHGTGTSLGDPIEVRALAGVFGQERNATTPLLLGSVKTNIGHLEAAAGIAGVIKTVLMLQHGEIAPHLHFKEPSPHIAWQELPVRVATARTPWPGIEGRRIAGISSFGLSGTNAHVIVEEAPAAKNGVKTRVERGVEVLALSAKTESALQEMSARFAQYVRGHEAVGLSDLCYSANIGRSHFAQRVAFVSRTREQLLEQLAAVSQAESVEGVVSGRVGQRAPKVAFLFSGQGSQYVGMGQQLFKSAGVYREVLLECEELLGPYLDQPLLKVLSGEAGAELLLQTKYTQPALFAVEYALARQWQSWGVEPAMLLGHSIGEYVAACVAGAFSLADGLKLVAARGRLMQEHCERGAMLAVNASESRVRAELAALEEEVWIAALNGPEQVVLSGRREVMERVQSRLAERGLRVKRLAVEQGFHSGLMEPMLEEFAAVAREIKYAPLERAVVSNVSGEVKAVGERLESEYWLQQVRETVRFSEGMQRLRSHGCEVYVEVGPQAQLVWLGQQCLGTDAGEWCWSLRAGRDEWEQMLESVGKLYVRGVDVKWEAVSGGAGRHKVALPSYPFQRQRYWAATSGNGAHRRNGKRKVNGGYRLLGERLRSPLIKEEIYELELSSGAPPYLKDHRVGESALLPAAGYLEMALAAGRAGYGAEARLQLEGVEFSEALRLSEAEGQRVQLTLTAGNNGEKQFEIYSQANGNGHSNGNGHEEEWSWTTHARGKLRVLKEAKQQEAGVTAALSGVALAALQEQCQEAVAVEEYYEQLGRHGLQYGPGFRGIKRLWRGADGEALGEVSLPEVSAEAAEKYVLHPVLLDSCFQLCGAALGHVMVNGGGAYLPVKVGQLQLHGATEGRLWGHVKVKHEAEQAARLVTGEVRLYDERGQVVAEVAGLEMKYVSAAVLASLGGSKAEEEVTDPGKWLYEVRWRAQARQGKEWRHLAPEYLLGPADIESRVGAEFAELYEREGLERQSQLASQLEQLSVLYVQEALAGLGWQWRVGERVRVADVAEQLGVVPAQQRLLGRLLQMLAEEGWLELVGEGEWRMRQVPEVGPTAAEECARLLALNPEATAELTLLERCSSQLGAVLTGARDALELLFPGGSLVALEQLYQHSPAMRVMNELAARAVATALEQLPKGRQLQVLEIGAGTGATTASILGVLPEWQTAYSFTDVSPLFTATAAQKFSAQPWLNYQVLDIERPPQEQGFAGQQFDLIIAANVLHATAELRETLRHIRELQAPGGELVLLETTGRQRYLDLIFGLTEGWWKFRDEELRHDYPLLTVPQWREVLKAAGYEAVAVLPEHEEERAAVAEQAVLLARAPRVAEAAETGRWLIFADEEGVGSGLIAELRARGEVVIEVRAGASYEVESAQQYRINASVKADYERVWQAAQAAGTGEWRGVVHLWNLDAGASVGQVEQALSLGCQSTLHLVQALAASGPRPRLWLVTSGAIQEQSEPLAGATQAATWGLAKVVVLEHPELQCSCVDLDPAAAEPAALLVAELWAADHENQLRLQDKGRYVARLVASEQQLAADQPVQLVIGERGQLDNLKLQPLQRRAPGAGEVEIEVQAAGLNFRDVLNAMGMYPGDPGPLGGECAGVVVQCGADVHDLRVGDRVMALAPASFSSYVTTARAFVLPLPEALSFAEGATIPAAFLTASYALRHLAQLRAGERVLIHAAAGGVGLAAVQLAQQVGAEVYATASVGKWEQLRALGVKHIANSRTLEFAEQVLEWSDGEGVDVVLNSLAGDYIAKSVAVLKRDGRFVELGKRGIWDVEQVRAQKPEARYYSFDLGAVAVGEPALLRQLFEQVGEEVQQGRLRPLPLQEFGIEQVVDAFRHMAQAKHVGKVVLRMARAAAVIQPEALSFSGEGSYLITGGKSGLGLLVAQWLVERGARHLILLGRQRASAQALQTIEQLRAMGVSVRLVEADVADRVALERVFSELKEDGPALRGVVHSAGVLEDGVLLQQDWGQFFRVLRTKAEGAWHLHDLSRHEQLDFFVLFSSAAALLGSPGQGNHAAANAFLDGLAQQRRAAGLAGLSINWGAWSEVGAAAARHVDQRMQLSGLGSIAPQQGLATLERVWRSPHAQVAVLPVQWEAFLEQYSGGMRPPFLTEVSAGVDQRSKQRSEFRQHLMSAPERERYDMLREHVREQVAKVLGMREGQWPDVEQGFFELGMDSLTSLELKNRLQASLEVTLPATLIFDAPNIQALSRYLAQEVLDLKTSSEAELAPAPVFNDPQEENLLERIQHLSDAEVDQLLAQNVAG